MSEQVKAACRARSKEKRAFSAVVVSFNRLISVHPSEASSNQIVLVGQSPDACLLGRTTMNLPCDEK